MEILKDMNWFHLAHTKTKQPRNLLTHVQDMNARDELGDYTIILSILNNGDQDEKRPSFQLPFLKEKKNPLLTPLGLNDFLSF